MDNNKFRPLLALKILKQYTDEKHPLTTRQISDYLLKEYGISAHRMTITSDINLLMDFGIDIILIKSSQNKYYIASRTFEIPELKLLIDAVQSSKFITAKKSEMYI